MPFDLVVTISMHFYERCQTKRDVWNFRSEKKGDSPYVCPFPPCVGSGYFLGFKILNFNIFFFGGGGGGVQKTEYFWGYEDFVDIF